MGKWQYFTDDEIKGLQDSLCQKLSVARGIAQTPFIITSGLRNQAENASLAESVKDSAHLTGNAIDLLVPDSSSRFPILCGLLGIDPNRALFKRIGIYGRHIHADDSPTLPPNVMWYVNGD